MTEVDHLLQALEFFHSIVGKEGPFYFDCQIIAHNYGIPLTKLGMPGAHDRFRIGQKGEAVTMEDVLISIRRLCKDKRLDKIRWDYGRSYYHEGYRVSEDGKTLRMAWGS